MRFMAGARATGGRGRAESRATGSQTLSAALRLWERQLSKGTSPALGPAPDPTHPAQSETWTQRLGLKPRPWPCPHPAPAEAKSPQSSAAARAGPQNPPSMLNTPPTPTYSIWEGCSQAPQRRLPGPTFLAFLCGAPPKILAPPRPPDAQPAQEPPQASTSPTVPFTCDEVFSRLRGWGGEGAGRRGLHLWCSYQVL